MHKPFFPKATSIALTTAVALVGLSVAGAPLAWGNAYKEAATNPQASQFLGHASLRQASTAIQTVNVGSGVDASFFDDGVLRVTGRSENPALNKIEDYWWQKRIIKGDFWDKVKRIEFISTPEKPVRMPDKYDEDYNESPFEGFTGTSISFKGVDFSNVTSMENYFEECKQLKSITFDSFDTSSVTNMINMFSGCSQLTQLDVSKFNTSKVTNMRGMFAHCESLPSIDVSRWDTSNVIDMTRMFAGCYTLESLPLSTWNTGRVTKMASMFLDSYKLTTIPVDNWDVSKVKDFSGMFSAMGNDVKAMGLTQLNLASWDTASAETFSYMFHNCPKLDGLNVSKFNTSNVTSFHMMFAGCRALTKADVSKWDTSSLESMHAMFRDCKRLSDLGEGNVSAWKTSKVSDSALMFYNCQALTKLDVSKWDMQHNQNIQMMFYWCLNLPELDTSAWTLAPAAQASTFRAGTSSAFGRLLSLKEIDLTKLGHCYHQGMVELNTLKVSNAAGNKESYPAALETLKMKAYKGMQPGPNGSVPRNFTQDKDFRTSFILPEKSHWNVYRLGTDTARQKKIATYDTDAEGFMQMANINPRITEAESLQPDTNYEFHMAHKLTFDPNGGTLAAGTLDYVYVDRHGEVKANAIVDKTAQSTGENPQAQIADRLTPPADKGKFLYWSTTPNGASDALATGMTITKDVTLYAIYAPKSQPNPPAPNPPAPNPPAPNPPAPNPPAPNPPAPNPPAPNPPAPTPTPNPPAPTPTPAPQPKPTPGKATKLTPKLPARLPKTADALQATPALAMIFSAAGIGMVCLRRRDKA